MRFLHLCFKGFAKTGDRDHRPLQKSFRGLHTLGGDRPTSALKYVQESLPAARLHFEKIDFFNF